MWILGLIVGVVIGAIGGGGGVVVGAIVGGFVGWLFSEVTKNAKQGHARLEATVSQLSDRVRALEERFTDFVLRFQYRLWTSVTVIMWSSACS